ncbi:hypothetical protein D1007_15639 [Hordeum vulgare]|nr:hypothetical protein D1007_15639 [Hordeum vulgare]
MATEGVRQAVGPALGTSMVLNREGLEKIVPMLASGLTQKYSPLLLTPSSPVAPSSRWAHALLVDPRLSPMRARLETLSGAGVTAALIMREFHRRWNAPLQHHSHPMWSFFGPDDPMRLRPGCLPGNMLDNVLQVLLSKSVGGLARKGHALYK